MLIYWLSTPSGIKNRLPSTILTKASDIKQAQDYTCITAGPVQGALIYWHV